MTPQQALSRRIEQTRRSKDGRGAWQAERACAERLGGSRIDAMAAAARAGRVSAMTTGNETAPAVPGKINRTGAVPTYYPNR